MKRYLSILAFGLGLAVAVQPAMGQPVPIRVDLLIEARRLYCREQIHLTTFLKNKYSEDKSFFNSGWCSITKTEQNIYHAEQSSDGSISFTFEPYGDRYWTVPSQLTEGWLEQKAVQQKTNFDSPHGLKAGTRWNSQRLLSIGTDVGMNLLLFSSALLGI
jgi:hypothetical protein